MTLITLPIAGLTLFILAFFIGTGGFLLDSVARLWFVIENQNLLNDYKLAVVLTEVGMSDHISEFLEYCGIEKSQLLIVTEPTQFAEIIIPDLSGHSELYTDEHASLFDYVVSGALKKNTNHEQFDKVFLAKRPFSIAERKDIGSDAIIGFFQKNGYKLVYTDHCSLARLIYVLQNCTHCACIDGGVALNMLFARRNAQLVVILKSSLADRFSYAMYQMRDLCVTIIDSHLSIFPSTWWIGPHLLAISDNLIHFARDNDMKLPKIQNISDNFLEYMHKYCVANNTMTNDKASENITAERLEEAYGVLHNKLAYGLKYQESRITCLIKKLSYELIYRISRSDKYKSMYLTYKKRLQQ